MATYSFVKPSIDPTVIANDIPGVLNIPMPDSIAMEQITFYGQVIYNPYKIIFTFASALSGPEESDLNSYMSTYNGISTDGEKIDLADGYLAIGWQIIQGINAKMQLDGKTDTQKAAWFSQIEGVMNALNAGFLTVALDRLTSITATLINFLTGTMTSTEVTELRQLLQKLLGKTLT